MSYLSNKFGTRPRRAPWVAILALTALMVLALACQGNEPAPAPAPAPAPQIVEVDSGAVAAAAEAKAAAEQALAAAEQAMAAATNPQAAEIAAQAHAAAQQSLTAAEQALAAAKQAQAAAQQAQAAAETPRRGEDRPTISVIGGGTASVSASGTGTGTGSVSGIGHGHGTGSVSGVGTGTGSGTGVMSGQMASAGLTVPTNLSYETSGPTKSDGYYTATTHREIYQKISTDYQEIAKLTNVIRDGEPLPAAAIWLLYEAGYHTRIGAQSRTLASFARDPRRATDFPVAAEFYGSSSFLDSPIRNAVRGRGEAADYTDAQKRQAINKGVLRILYHWAKFYMIIGQERMSSRLIDEAWAVYVGEEVNGRYPNSLAAFAQAREGNFGRQGALDIPLRQAMDRARQAADAQDAAALEQATNEVYSRFNAMFYLATVRYIGRVLDDAAAGNHDALGTHQVEALAFYQSIQPEVAQADPAADETIMAYLTAGPGQVTAASRDGALAALNGTASALLLMESDLVTEYTDDTGDGSGLNAPPDTGYVDTSSSIFIPVDQEYETSSPTKSDGYFHPTTHREIYQKISSDYQEIAALTNVIRDGHPLPAADILLMYEAGIHTRLGPQSRTLRSFAQGSSPASSFPESAEFYGSDTFLHTPVNNAIRGRGEAADYTDAQKRQAINKGVLRILYHWAKFYMIIGVERIRSGLIDEAWAVYVGEEVNGEYPNSLAALARSREGNFGREGTLDIPLREAMERARLAAEAGDQTALEAAAQDVYSRFNAIFYLATVRYIGISQQDVEEGKDPGTHQVEALAFYQSIQPEVANANPTADETIVAYLTADASQLTTESRDAALAALNSAASALLLKPEDLVSSY